MYNIIVLHTYTGSSVSRTMGGWSFTMLVKTNLDSLPIAVLSMLTLLTQVYIICTQTFEYV